MLTAPMYLLAVDTTSRWGSVALLHQGEVCGEVRLREEGGGHSTTVFPGIEHLLKSLGRRPSDIEGFAVAVGPGSFTGVRVGISTVQGLVLGSGRPVIGVTSLEALAAKMQDAADALVPMVDAYRDQVFAAVYDAELSQQREPAAIAPEDWLDVLPRGAALLGDGARRYRDRLAARRPDLVFPPRSLFLAATIGRLAQVRLARGQGIDAFALHPLYLRGADIRPSHPQPTGPA
jgi:tRNA threonylcarbamoyladenosine biosynthesis protein TsaB